MAFVHAHTVPWTLPATDATIWAGRADERSNCIDPVASERAAIQDWGPGWLRLLRSTRVPIVGERYAPSSAFAHFGRRNGRTHVLRQTDDHGRAPTMRVLVTGHHGYIGSVAVLSGAGHEVTGVDTYFSECCDFVGDRVDVSTLSMDVRDVTEEALQGYDAIIHLAVLSNYTLGELDTELTGAPRDRGAGYGRRRRQACAATHLRRPAACRGVGDGRPDDQARVSALAYRLRRVEGAGGMSPLRARRRRFRPRLHAERHGIRRFPTCSLRPRAQQLVRVGFHQRQGSDHERRDAMAASGPRARHHGGSGGRSGGADRADRKPSLQRRDEQRELPRPGARRDRARDLSGVRDRVRGVSRSRSPQLPCRLLETGRGAPGCHGELDGQRRSPRAARCLPVGGSHVPELRHLHSTLEAQIACRDQLAGR